MVRFDGISSLALSNLSQFSIRTGQLKLAMAQVELSTGRHHDVGLELGARTGFDIQLRLELSDVVQAMDLTGAARVRADLTQTTFQSLSQLATGFLSTLSGARGAEQGQSVAYDAARSALAAFRDLMNTTLGGEYIFGGVTSDRPPVRSYDGGTAEMAVNAAFLAEFGIEQTDPAVEHISASEMKSYVDGALAELFSADSWIQHWSQASSANVEHRLGSGSLVDIASNANETFAVKLAQAFTTMIASGKDGLSQAAFQATVDKAMTLIGEAQLGIGAVQSRVGICQHRLIGASETLESRKTALSSAIHGLETVDSYEAATRVNTLMTQMEASYAITGRISRMSLLTYL